MFFTRENNNAQDGHPEEPGGGRRRRHLGISFWTSILRCLQLTLAFVTVCLTSYKALVFGGDFFHTFGLDLYAFVWTCLFSIYIYGMPFWRPKYYRLWGHITLEIVAVISWLAAFSLLVWECQAWDAAEDIISAVLSPNEVAAINSVPMQQPAIRGLKAATALSGVITVLFVITTILDTR